MTPLIYHYPSNLDLDAIAADYPDRAILESDGQVQRWLRVRYDQLYARARHYSLSCNLTKLGGLVAMVGGVFAWTTATGGLAGALGLVGWVLSVVEDHNKTREIYPVPFVREDIFNVLNKMGRSSARDNNEEALEASGLTDFHLKTIALLTHLPVEQYAEARMLLINRDEVSRILNSVQLNIRFLLYLRVVEHYINFGELNMNRAEVDRAIENALHDYSVDYGRAAHLSQLAGERSFGISQRSTEVLPPAPQPLPVAPTPVAVAPAPVVPQPVSPTPVSPTPVSPTPVAVAPVEEVDFEIPDLEHLKETGLNKIIGDPFESRAFFGAQRTGKSYFVAVASQKLAELGVDIYHLNLASLKGGDDDRYWHHTVKSVRADLSESTPSEASKAIGDAIQLVQDFRSAPAGAILVVDEATILGRKTNEYSGDIEPLTNLLSSIIATYRSSGKQRQKAIWTIAPDMVAGGLIDSAKLALKDLNLVLVCVPPWKSVTWQRADGRGLPSTVSFDHQLFEQVQRNYSGVTEPKHSGFLAGADRITFISGTWYPVGVDANSLKPAVVKPNVEYVPIAQTDPLATEFERHKLQGE